MYMSIIREFIGRGDSMLQWRSIVPLFGGIALLGLAVAVTSASESPKDNAAPRADITLPADYRDWSVIAVAREEGKIDDVRAILGNDIAFRAARAGTLPYPDGSVIVRLAWSFDPLAESAQAFGQAQSFTSGHPKNGVQLMIKDAVRYGGSGGWGFAQFDDGNGRLSSEAVQRTCLACHAIVEDRDFVFNRYAK
jgi:hypothetical protein